MTQAAPAPTAASTSLVPVLMEYREESATTRRCLERVPADKLAWKPSPASLSLGQLALHIASLPGNFARILPIDTFEPPPGAFTFNEPKDVAEILKTFDDGLVVAQDYLSSLTDAALAANWTVTKDGRPLITLPRWKAIRMWVISHSVHHRGQLSVYLRELGVPVPSIYGPSGDENPFAPR
jgi:uncharacterized damage-inducible protein DinB